MLLLAGAGLLAAATAHSPAFGQDDDEDRRTPAEGLEALEAYHGLEVQLFAAEPHVRNPVNMDVDAEGRIWVVEGVNYRSEANPQNPVREAGDRIVILEDTTGNGRADTETLFYEGHDVDAAMGLTVLGDSVLVAAYDEMFYLVDEDGDGVADRKNVLFTDISDPQTDHSSHTGVIGPDGKLYFAFGNSARHVHDADGDPIYDQFGRKASNQTAHYRQGMVFRTDPDGSDLEFLGDNFRNPFELAVDSYGTVWQSDNDDDGSRACRINYVMDYGNFGYVDEKTEEHWRAPRTGRHEEIPKRHWHVNDPGVVPNAVYTGAGSPTGLSVYEGELLSGVAAGQLIHADAGPNEIRWYPITEERAGFKGRVETLVKGVRDQWFRPTDVAVAPDGSVFFADWYDPVVGGHAAGDPRRGRIYRVAPEGTPYEIADYRLDTPEAAVATLGSPNQERRYLAWHRLHAWQEEAEPALASVYRDRSGRSPRYRARALWLLTKIDGRGRYWVREGLDDPDPHLRMVAVRAARQLEIDPIPVLEIAAGDSSRRVRREAALTLRVVDDPAAPELWAELAARHETGDRWYLEALGIGAEGSWGVYFGAWRERVGSRWNSEAGREIVWRARADAAMPLLADLIADPSTSLEERQRYFRAFDFHTGGGKQEILTDLLDRDHPDASAINTLVLRHVNPDSVRGRPEVERALDEALDRTRGTAEFVTLVERFEIERVGGELLDYALTHPETEAGARAAGLLVEFGERGLLEQAAWEAETERARAAAGLLGAVEYEEKTDVLIDLMRSDRPLEVRRAATRAYGEGFFETRRLFELVRDGGLPEDLEPTAAGILMNAFSGEIRREAAKLLGREDALESRMPPVRQLASHEGDPAAGRRVFERACQRCHVVVGEGVEFGPDLSQIGSKLSKLGLYTAILHPSAGVAHGYGGVTIETVDGARLVGYVESENDRVVRLRMQGGVTREIPKNEIVSRTELDRSLMPETAAGTLDQREIIDLVEYLDGLTAERES